MSESSNPLGRKAAIPEVVDASVLFAIARGEARKALAIDAGPLPFAGDDIWNAWELSWLDARGKPCIAVAVLRVPCDSPRIVESKSLKLYLGGFAMTRFDDVHAVRARITDDLAALLGAPIEVQLLEPDAFARLQVREFAGLSLDNVAIEARDYHEPAPQHLAVRPRARPIEESLVSQLFRSRCPVTGQPDWASVQVRYRGRPIDHAGLLRYLVSFREHAAFHEACVEQIFTDIESRCRPLGLLVYARFLRRGGIDINPWRATPGFTATPANVRAARQ